MSVVDRKGLHTNSLFCKLFDIYRFENLVQRFPCVTSVRAGICLVVDTHLLLVRERGYNSHLGPPKGLAELCDASALATALRELYEETGICIQHKTSNLPCRSHIKYKLLPETFQYHDERNNVLSVYYVIVASERPFVKIDRREIESYEWRDMSCGLKKKMSEYSEPTKSLFTQFDNTIVYKRWQLVFSRMHHKSSLNPVG